MQRPSTSLRIAAAPQVDRGAQIQRLLHATVALDDDNLVELREVAELFEACQREDERARACSTDQSA